MLQDLRYGLKLLWKEKAFTITALATLGLCIGANTAIFTVLNAVVLEPLPFPDSERLARIGNSYPGARLYGGSTSRGTGLPRQAANDGRVRGRRGDAVARL